MLKQTKIGMNTNNETSNQTTIKNAHEAHFVYVNYLWTWDLPWSVVDVTNNTTLERIIFPLPGGIIAHSFIARDGTLCPLLLLSVIALLALNP